MKKMKNWKLDTGALSVLPRLWAGAASNIKFAFAKLRRRTGWKETLAVCLAFCVLELGLSWSAHAATITTFDVPGVVGSRDPFSINPAGVTRF